MSQATVRNYAEDPVFAGAHWVGVYNIFCPEVGTEVYYTLTREAPVCAGCGNTITQEFIDKESSRPLAQRLLVASRGAIRKLTFKAPKPGKDYYHY